MCLSLRQKGYREMLRQSLTLDSEGRPFRMLVFRGSPKSRRKRNYVIDEMRRDIDAEVLSNGIKQHESRRLPTVSTGFVFFEFDQLEHCIDDSN